MIKFNLPFFNLPFVHLRLCTFLLPVCSLLFGCQDDNAQPTDATATHNHNSHDHGSHDHGQLDILSVDPQAKKHDITLSIDKDTMSGWNIHIGVDSFAFTPEKVNQGPSIHEGHAHLYIDNFKIARLYHNWYHLKDLTPGEHTIQITLNANNHQALTFDGEPLQATVRITQE